MRRSLLGFVLALVAPVSAFAIDFPVSATVSGDAGLWELPNSQAAIIGKVLDGTEVTITACHDAWCAISATGVDGHVIASRLVLESGQTARDTLRAEIQAIGSAQRIVVVGRSIWTDGDSYMFGELTRFIGEASSREVETAAIGGSEMSAIAARMVERSQSSARKSLTIIWDGSNNGMADASSYADQLADGINGLGHDHFIVIPSLHGPQRQEVAAEFKARWPDNVFDWREALGEYEGDDIPRAWLKDPDADPVHLNVETKEQVARAVAQMIRRKGW